MKIKLFYLIIIIFSIACKQTNKRIDNNSQISKNRITKTKNSKPIKVSYSFEDVIKCERYGYGINNIYGWGDYGCLYNPKNGNIYGNLNIYLIPKIGIKKYNKEFIGVNDENISSESSRINNLSIYKIKQEFNIYLFLVPKKYLEHTPTLDASYSIRQSDNNNYKFKTEFYRFNNKTKKWKLIEVFEVLQKNDNKAWEWEQKKIKEIIDKSN